MLHLGLHGLFQGKFTYTFYLVPDSQQCLPVINDKTLLYCYMSFVFHLSFQFVHLCTCNVFIYRTVNILNLYTVALHCVTVIVTASSDNKIYHYRLLNFNKNCLSIP
jgi:hypothetical protein